eukprot:TRINITY_DN2713_c0_g1_i3.p1 TRINITY_DN2713_c0_g1~~TRINITY_DN2713_c0_g1_i3.p1  ORF type:complete len:190 (+),score=25.03 TRINITY_DN2713_c0_g1_i3:571-1140(+)
MQQQPVGPGGVKRGRDAGVLGAGPPVGMLGSAGLMARGRKFQKRPARPAPGPCWFCLSSPDVDKHLIACIGENVYVALPKGGLHPEHVLILPITHYSTSSSLLDEEVRDEITAFKEALLKYYQDKGMSCIMYERFLTTLRNPQHTCIEVIPVSTDVAARAKEVILAEGKKAEIQFDEITETQGISEVCT